MYNTGSHNIFNVYYTATRNFVPMKFRSVRGYSYKTNRKIKQAANKIVNMIAVNRTK